MMDKTYCHYCDEETEYVDVYENDIFISENGDQIDYVAHHRYCENCGKRITCPAINYDTIIEEINHDWSVSRD